MEISKLIDNLITERKINQTDFAQSIDSTQAQVSDWISGKSKPSYDKLQAIGIKYKVDANELLDLDKKIAINKPIRIFETFSGIGAQAAAFNRMGINYEVVATSDWYINALLAYDAIHNYKKKIKYPSKEDQIEYLKQFTFSKDSATPIKDISKLDARTIKKLYRANKLSNNLGSITDIESKDIPDHDLLTYSFPCQDLSTGGKTLGMKKGSGTRSGLLWEIERILTDLNTENRLPKSLLMENVKAILADSNKKDLDCWLEFLEGLGYKNYKPLVLSGIDFGIPQDRERCFIVSSLDKNLKLDIEKKMNRISKEETLKFLKLNYNNKTYKQEADEAQLNRTPSREEMWEINKRDLNNMNYFYTITTNMDRQNNAGMILYNGIKGDSYRLPTAREAFMLMGFTEKEYERVKKLGFSYRQMIKLAGNSIIVNVIQAIFEEMFKGVN